MTGWWDGRSDHEDLHTKEKFDPQGINDGDTVTLFHVDIHVVSPVLINCLMIVAVNG